MDAIVVGREGQWRTNKEEEKKKNEERGGVGGGALSMSEQFRSCVCACVFVWLVAVVAVTAAHPCSRRFPFLDCSLLLDLHGAGGMMSSGPCVSATRKKIASPTERTSSQTCTLSAPDLVARSVWLVV